MISFHDPNHAPYYTVFVGDGDSSYYRAVVNENIYGPTVSISNENCVGRIQKRMGTRLRKIVQNNKGVKLSDGKSVSGKGRLTLKIIDSFMCVGIALWSNKNNLAEMQRRPWLSWITMLPLMIPLATTCVLLVRIPDVSFRWTRPLVRTPTYFIRTPYQRGHGSGDACQNALTQNGIECIHAMLWKIVPKRRYAGEAAYVLAVALTAGYFNDGQLAFNYSIYKTLGISNPCESSATTWHRPPHTSDGRVLQQRSVKDKEKRHKEVEDAFQKQEGTTYKSSKFLDTQTRPQRLCKHCKLHVICDTHT